MIPARADHPRAARYYLIEGLVGVAVAIGLWFWFRSADAVAWWGYPMLGAVCAFSLFAIGRGLSLHHTKARSLLSRAEEGPVGAAEDAFDFISGILAGGSDLFDSILELLARPYFALWRPRTRRVREELWEAATSALEPDEELRAVAEGRPGGEWLAATSRRLLGCQGGRKGEPLEILDERPLGTISVEEWYRDWGINGGRFFLVLKLRGSDDASLTFRFFWTWWDDAVKIHEALTKAVPVQAAYQAPQQEKAQRRTVPQGASPRRGFLGLIQTVPAWVWVVAPILLVIINVILIVPELHNPNEDSNPNGSGNPSTVLSSAEQALAQSVGPLVRPSCTGRSPEEPGSIAAIDCRVGGAHLLILESFRGSAQMNAAFGRYAGDLPDGDCSTDWGVAGEWSLGGSVRGRVKCYDAVEGGAWMVWTDEPGTNVGWISRHDQRYRALYEAWVAVGE